jgi:coenzyme F420-reducing hydrogenase beta subunit
MIARLYNKDITVKIEDIKFFDFNEGVVEITLNDGTKYSINDVTGFNIENDGRE